MAAETPPFVISAAEHGAALFRQMPQSFLSGTGVVGSGDLLVTPNSPAGMSVLVAPGTCWIPGTILAGSGFGTNAGAQSTIGNTNGGTTVSTGFPGNLTAQGPYFAYNDGQITVGIASSNPTLPRMDLICATVADAQYAGSSNAWTIQVVTGTAGATPAPPTVPQNSIVLSSVWVPAAASSITSGDLNDLRPFTAVGHSSGAVNIAASQSRTNTAYGTLATPDQVTIDLPGNGLIAVWYQAAWQSSVASAGSAALMLGATVLAAIGIGASSGTNYSLSTNGGAGFATATPYTPGTTGIIGTGANGGPSYVYAPAGTYTISVQYKASSGSVTASNRMLMAQVLSLS